MAYLGVVLLEASRSKKDEASEVGGLALQASGDSIDQQGGAPQAVPYGPQPIGLPLFAIGLLPLCATAAAAPAACLATLLAFHPEKVGSTRVRDAAEPEKPSSSSTAKWWYKAKATVHIGVHLHAHCKVVVQCQSHVDKINMVIFAPIVESIRLQKSRICLCTDSMSLQQELPLFIQDPEDHTYLIDLECMHRLGQ